MGDPAAGDPRPASLSVLEMMAWVAGLAALAGLFEEVLRRSSVEGNAGVIGGFLVSYVVYVSLSVRSFWRVPGIAVPTTMLIGGVTWTLSLQALDRLPMFWAVAMVATVPFATALGIGLIFRKLVDADDRPEDPGCPSTVRSLLIRSKGLGPRSVAVEATTEPEP